MRPLLLLLARLLVWAVASAWLVEELARVAPLFPYLGGAGEARTSRCLGKLSLGRGGASISRG